MKPTSEKAPNFGTCDMSNSQTSSWVLIFFPVMGKLVSFVQDFHSGLVDSGKRAKIGR